MHLDIPAGDFAGYIFDLDGTLIDSSMAHYRAYFSVFLKSSQNLFLNLGP
jgi:beta-phosphoglucomutase-like phosphatase (HAD superfamily)